MSDRGSALLLVLFTLLLTSVISAALSSTVRRDVRYLRAQAAPQEESTETFSATSPALREEKGLIFLKRESSGRRFPDWSILQAEGMRVPCAERITAEKIQLIEGECNVEEMFLTDTGLVVFLKTAKIEKLFGSGEVICVGDLLVSQVKASGPLLLASIGGIVTHECDSSVTVEDTKERGCAKRPFSRYWPEEIVIGASSGR